MDRLVIRPLAASDLVRISSAFAAIGWHKPASQYERYREEQTRGERAIWVAEVDGDFAGYVTLVWEPDYLPLREAGLPEIQDLNVLPPHRRSGLATRLVDTAESEAARRVGEVGIGVGLHPGYNAAQRMYVQRGYVPDAKGVTYRNEPVPEGASAVFDDELVLHLTKVLEPRESAAAAFNRAP